MARRFKFAAFIKVREGQNCTPSDLASGQNLSRFCMDVVPVDRIVAGFSCSYVCPVLEAYSTGQCNTPITNQKLNSRITTIKAGFNQLPSKLRRSPAMRTLPVVGALSASPSRRIFTR